MLVAALLTIGTLGQPFDLNDAIQPSEANPRYWQYQGEPVVLLGASREDNLFQIDGIEAHLDTLANAGGNYIRNTMSSRDEGNIWPFAQRPDGKYDLETPNAEYFEKLDRCLRWAYERDIIVQIEVWDRFDYAREIWERNPFRPANNVNYTVESSKLENHYPRHPGSNENPFFFTTPPLHNNEVLLRFQHAHVDRVLAVALQYPNVLFCMDNETSGAERWGSYWADYIKAKAREAGVRAHVTEMWDDWNLRSATHRRTLDHPDVYDFADISQNNHQKGQTHWDNLQWARAYIAESPRPLNNVKIYGADAGPFGNNRDAVERFWRGLIGGAASVRFHRPDAGIGLSEEAQAHVRSARMLCNEFGFTTATPDAKSEKLADREENEAYLTVAESGACAVYFPNGGELTLTLPDKKTNGTIRWLDVENATWSSERGFEGGQAIALTVPGDGHWVALIEV